MVVVTGGTGVLGEFLLQKLSESGAEVVAIRRKHSTIPNGLPIRWEEADLSDPNRLTDVFKDASIVIHAAAHVSFNPRERDLMMQINVEGTQHVVNACLTAGVPRLLHVSSVAALGRQRGVKVIDESSKWIESSLNSDYAESKYLAELEVYRGQEEGLAIDIINPSVILAPNRSNRSSAQIFHYVLKKRKFFTEGQVNYVDVRDVATATLKLMERNATGQRYILNGGHIEIQRLLEAIAQRLDVRAPSIKVPNSILRILVATERLRSAITGSPPWVTAQTLRGTKTRFQYNNRKAVNDLGLQFTDLENTLDWCCNWYRTAYNKQSIPAS